MIELDFIVANLQVTHCFYVLDSLPIEQKIILGMDFLTNHHACINICKREITLEQPISQPLLSCKLQHHVRIPPRKNLRVNLLVDNAAENACSSGYLHSVKNLPDGCIVWHGVQEQKDSQIVTYISNQSDKNIEFEPHTQLAWWEPDIHGEIRSGDTLVSKAKEKRGQRQEEAQDATPLSILTLQGEDWEWADQHLYLDLSQTPVGDPDPPVDASLQQLKAAQQKILKDLGECSSDVSEDGCNEQRRLAQQLERIIARMKCFSTDGEEPADLPPELRLEEG